jgi:large subunit ribosomal protein L13Ae
MNIVSIPLLRKEISQLAYEKKKQINKLRVKAEKIVHEKLGFELQVLLSSTE